MHRIRVWLCASLVTALMAFGLAVPAQAGYGSGGNCAVQYYTEIETDTYSSLKTTHTYYPSSGNGVAHSVTRNWTVKTKSPYLTGSWVAQSSSPYEAFETMRRNCLPRPM